MADVITSEAQSVMVAAPHWGEATRKYAVEVIGTFFLTFTVAALGAATAGMFAWQTLWVYLVVQVLAGVAAGLTFLALNPDDK
jgi:glycerol uptake facilitator-like aquaporin